MVDAMPGLIGPAAPDARTVGPSMRPAAPVPPADWPSRWARFTHPHRFFSMVAVYPEEAYRRPILERRVGGRTYLLVSHPDGIAQVMHGNVANYPRNAKSLRLLRPLLGRSVVISDGEEWQRQRRTVAPVFRPTIVHELVPMFAAKAAALGDRWKSEAGRGIDMAREMHALTLAIIGGALFAREIGGLERLPRSLARYLGGAQVVEALIAM